MPNSITDIEQFLKDYPEMYIIPSRETGVVLKGIFRFSAKLKDAVLISDFYNLKIIIPANFPSKVPTVIELDEKIHRDADHHINSDNSICLGSPLRLKIILSKNESLTGFAESILVPFLYSISHQRQFGGKLLADELAHGEQGIVDDYCNFLKLYTSDQIIASLIILGTKRRIANKMKCPCNCGKVYGDCKFKKVLEQYRFLATRRWYIDHAEYIESFTENNKYKSPRKNKHMDI